MKGYCNKYSRKILKSILLITIIIVNGLFSKSALAYTPETVLKSDLSVDESKFDVEWYEKRIVKVYQTEKTKDPDFNVGDYLGYAEIEIGFATEKDNDDEYIEQMILFRTVMHPRYITDTKQSVPYVLLVNVTRNDDMWSEVVCAGSNINQKFGKEEAVIYITNIDDNGNLSWDFLYNNQNKKEFAGYPYEKSELYGVAKWAIEKDVEYKDWTFDIKVTASFTGGSKENNYIIKDDGHPKELGECEGTFSINVK